MDFVRFVPPADWGFSDDLCRLINDVSVEADVAPCATAAIVKRESAGQNVLEDGTDLETMLLPDGSTPGVGICQITYDVDWTDLAVPIFHGVRRPKSTYVLFDQKQNLECACYEFFRDALSQAYKLRIEYPGEPWSSNVLYLVFALFNAGQGRVQRALRNHRDPDTETTDNYASGTFALYEAALKSSHAAA